MDTFILERLLLRYSEIQITKEIQMPRPSKLAIPNADGH